MTRILPLVLLLLPALLLGQNVRPVDKAALLDMLSYENDTTYVVNFWATWCSPCVKEIGYFEELRKSTTGEQVQIILVNLDFPNQVERRVIPFIRERNLKSTVVNMTDLDYNSWISQVDGSWSGAIPATLVYRGSEHTFIEGEINREQLFSMVESLKQK